MTSRGLFDQSAGAALTPSGLGWLAGLGIELPEPAAGRRPVVRLCLDWTERRPHLAGAAGAALCARFLAAGWIERTARHRAIRVTAAGERALAEQLGLDVPRLTGALPAAG
ncbi:MAG TPA: hypothetical protein VMU51_12495 [Mycobacteriales bacterium]|nr:hypothetical protein [Mycobacteriales bacterium]